MMIRLSEEQRGILSCYSGAKEKVIRELQKAITFIEDVELREESEDLIFQIEKMTDSIFEEIRKNIMDSFEDDV